MPARKVTLKIDRPLDIGNVGIEFEVRTGSTLLGRAQITKGGIDWWPPKTRQPRSVTWEEFAESMNYR
jgi:hypothetical protein